MAQQSKKARYIAQKLTKYFPKKYPSYTSAVSDAKLVYAQILDANERVNLKNIFSKIRTPRITKANSLDFILKSKGWREMMSIQHYFDLANFQQYLFNCPNNLGFTSKLLPASTHQPVMGGANKAYTYDTLFGPYINYINSIKKQTADDDQRYQSDWFIKITEPKYKNKIWVSQVISVDGNGNEFDYLFDPSQPTKESEEPVLSGAEVPVQASQQEVEVSDAKEAIPATKTQITDDQEFLLKLEQAKAKTAAEQAAMLKEKRAFIAELKELGYSSAEIKKELDKL